MLPSMVGSFLPSFSIDPYPHLPLCCGLIFKLPLTPSPPSVTPFGAKGFALFREQVMNQPETINTSKHDRDRFVALAFCWGDLLFELDVFGTITFCAGPLEAFTGSASQQVIGTQFVDMVSSADSMIFESFQRKTRDKVRLDDQMIRLKRATGAVIDVLVSGYWMDERFYLALRLRGKAGRPPLVNQSQPDFADTETFSQKAGRQIKTLEAQGQTPEMAIIGIPGLDELRDSLDETRAKAVLASVGLCLSASSIGGETAVKITDETFGLLQNPGNDLGGLHSRLSAAISAIAPGASNLQLSKVSLALDVARDLSELDLTRGLMYALGSVQKQSLRGSEVSSISETIFASISQSLSDIRNFRQIIDEKKFFVALQPIIDIRHGNIHHFEALCRFDISLPHNSPYQYITMGEEAGLIHEFDVAMAAKVIALFKKLPINNQKYSVSINISGFSIGVPEYVDALHALLQENPWTQGRLLFEITESYRISDLDVVNKFIQGLRRNHYKVCLDDFGAGAASFQYLSALDVDVVKIDGSAVRNAQKATKGRAFLTALTELCARLGVKTIAEMVDSPESLAFVRDCGCDYVQGFLFGKPSRDAADFHPLPNLKLFR